MTASANKSSPSTDEFVFVEAAWDLQHTYRAGARLSECLGAFKERKLLGGKVEATGRVIFPAASSCEISYEHVTKMVPVGPTGVIRAFGVVEMHFAGKAPPPYTLVYVQLDGANTASLGVLENSPEDRRADLVGRRVCAKFVVEPVGDWTDFVYQLD